jgi:ATP synthase protein I
MSKTGSTFGSKTPANFQDEEAQQEEISPPWTAEQAEVWRQSHPTFSVWWVLMAQVLVALVFATAVAFWFASGSIWLSWMYGAITVVVPAALFARGLTSRTASLNAMAAALGLMVWQGVKWMMAVLFLVLAPRIVPELSWPAMLAGLVVTMKVYWLALLWGRSATAAAPSTTL